MQLAASTSLYNSSIGFQYLIKTAWWDLSFSYVFIQKIVLIRPWCVITISAYLDILYSIENSDSPNYSPKYSKRTHAHSLSASLLPPLPLSPLFPLRPPPHHTRPMALQNSNAIGFLIFYLNHCPLPFNSSGSNKYLQIRHRFANNHRQGARTNCTTSLQWSVSSLL